MRKIKFVPIYARKFIYKFLCVFFSLIITIFPSTTFAAFIPHTLYVNGAIVSNLEYIPGLEPLPGWEATPTPEPTVEAVATEVPKYNLKINIQSSDGKSLQGYYAVFGEAYAPLTDGVANFYRSLGTNSDIIKIFTPDKKQVGSCELFFKSGSSTSMSEVQNGYEITLSEGEQNAYISAQLDSSNNGELTLIEISNQPIAEKIPVLPTFDAPSSNDQTEIITPSLHPGSQITSGVAGRPNIGGYIIGPQGEILPYSEIKYKNKNTNKLQKAGVDAQGAFLLTSVSPGCFSLTAFSSGGNQIANTDLVIEEGDVTNFKSDASGNILTYRHDATIIYLNLQANSKQQLLILAVSDSPLQSPAYISQPGIGNSTASQSNTSQTVEITPPQITQTYNFSESEIQNLILHPIIVIGVSALCIAACAAVIYFILKRKKHKKHA